MFRSVASTFQIRARLGLPTKLTLRRFVHDTAQAISGLTKIIDPLAQKFPAVGALRGNYCFAAQKERYLGSAVYIGHQLILTAAHCLDDVVQMKFSVNGANWFDCTKMLRHPTYVYLNEDDRSVDETCFYDIGVAKLNGEPLAAKNAAEISFEQFYDGACIAVGYPMSRAFYTVHPKTGKPEKFAIFMPYCYGSREDGIHHQVGLTKGDERNVHPRETALYAGMSGGGLFFQNKLIGTASSSYKKFESMNRNAVGDHTTFASLGFHQKWLTKTMEELVAEPHPSLDTEQRPLPQGKLFNN